MKSIQTKNITPAGSTHTPFFKKESGDNFFGDHGKSFFNSNVVQTKLTVNEPGDVYEKEADSMADQVVQRLSNPASDNVSKNTDHFFNPQTSFLQRACTECEQKEKLQEKEEEDNDLAKDQLRKKPIFESNAEPPDDDEENVQRKCAECEQKDDAIQEKSDSSSPQVSSSIQSALNASKGSGEPMAGTTLQQMESSFGADFSNVRIHNDGSAEQMSKDLGAQAFTHGSDIYFNSGKYDANSNSGKHLLAHELTHTIQQGESHLSRKENNCAGSISSQKILVIQRKEFTNEEQREQIKQAIKDRDIGKIKELNAFRFDLADNDQKIAMINILLDQTWVGPRDEYYLEHIWGSFGKSLPDLLADPAYFNLWNQCIKRSVDLYGIPEMMGLKLQFSSDVVKIALGYLSANRDKANKEKERYGLNDGDKSPTEQQSNELTGLNKKVQDAKKVLNIQKSFRTIQVGFENVLQGGGAGKPPVLFNPEKKPLFPLDDEKPPYARWMKLKDTDDKLSAIIDGYVAEYPVLFALIQGEKTDSITENKDKKSVQNILRESLDTLLNNIVKAEGILNDPSSKFPLELDPIHKQMFQSYPPWNHPFQKDLGKNLIEEHGDIQFWKSLGLGAIQLGLFVVAEITTGGLATFFLIAGAAGSAAMAADSWSNYMDTKTLANTNLSKETSLLSKEKADAALLEAVMNTAFALLDIYGAGKAIAEGIKDEAKLAQTLANAEEKESKVLVEAGEKDLKNTLEVTGSKEGNQLSQDEMKAEAEWSKENFDKAIPSKEPGYVTEINLPNGHTWRKTPEGVWCRFSTIPTLCAIDFEGALEIKPTRIISTTEISHDIGVQQGREFAEKELKLEDAGLVNPFDEHGKYGQGFDDFMRPKGTDELVLVEYKGGDSKLVAEQMEPSWVLSRIERMRKEGGEVGNFIADILEQKLKQKKLSGIALSTPVAENGVPGKTTVIKRWTY